MRDGQRRRSQLLREWAFVCAALLAFATVVASGSWTWRLDQALYDAGLALAERPDDGRIVIVEIDESSLSTIGRWPWPRSVHADLLERIAAAGPKAVGIDIAFIEPDSADPEGDRRLAGVLASVPGAVLASIMDGPREIQPLPALRAQARLGHVAVALDADGVLRSIELLRRASGEDREHMALAMLRAAGAAPGPAAGTLNIAFAGPPGHFRRIAAAKVLRGEVPPAELTGRFVFIGATAAGLGDRFSTPSTARGGPMPGVEVMANALDNLLSGRRIVRASPWTVTAATCVAVLALLALFLSAPSRVSLWAALGTALGAPLLAFAVLGATLTWFAPMTLFATALLAYPLWSWRRLEAASRYLDEELVRLRGESLAAGDRRQPRGGRNDALGRRIDAVSDAVGMLRSARRFISDSLEGLPHGALVAGLDGRVAIANRHAESLDPAPAVGRMLEEALAKLAPVDGRPWPVLLAEARERGIVSAEAGAADGRSFVVRLGTFRDGDGRDAGLIAIAEDVSALRQAQREQEETLSFVSHDLRSPQSTIIALAELQRFEETRTSESEFAAKVEQLAWKTAALAEDFVHLTRADSKPLALASVDLARLAQDCVEDITPQAAEPGITLAFAPADGPMLVQADRSLVTRALTNLLSNAIKYGGRGTRVTVTTERHGAEVRCTVSDQGVGLSPEDRARLFRHFERIDSVTRATRAKGIGLGLVFVETVARRHGGRVTVESELGKGSSFSLWLPAAPEPQTAGG